VALLEVEDLHVSFNTADGVVQAVRGVSYHIEAGQTLGIVGESGSGKSVSTQTIMGLTRGARVSGRALFEGEDLLAASPDQMRAIRGAKIGMIFQDPLSSLHPYYRVGWQIVEMIRLHDHEMSKDQAMKRAVELLRLVGIPQPDRRVNDFPHQFSGGMRQRAMIAMAMALNPTLLIADEPTTALDVTVQAQILELLGDLNRELGTAIIMITHNMGVVAGLCSRVIVMYAGQIVEQGPVDQIFANPQHPYTWSLLKSIPRVDAVRHERLRSIEGIAPDLLRPPKGCRFHPRCPFRIEKCYTEEPTLKEVAPDDLAACWVTMDRARKEMGADELVDIRPGAGSGYRRGELR